MPSFRHAFSLSKDEVRDATPPGTAVMIDNELVRTATGTHENREQHIHLVPEPSADPADPLNLPMWRKIVILWLMGIYAFLANFSSAVLSSALPNLVTAFATFSPHGPPTGIVSFPTLVHLIAVNSLMLGAFNIIGVPLGNIFGRRPVILFSLALLMGTSIWCGKATTFNSLLAGRVIQGCGGAAADTLAPTVVGEIFFLHQRGRALSIYTTLLTAGSLVGGIAGGYIVGSNGWRWTMYISAIMAGILLVLCALFQSETLYDREYSPRRQDSPSLENEKDVESKVAKSHVEHGYSDSSYRPYTFTRSLGFRKPKSGLVAAFFTPWLALRLPGTWMVMFHYAGLVGLIVSISTVAPSILAAPPYLWGDSVGLINVGGIVGCILGAFYTYLTTDWLLKRAAKHESHGFGEPERRLPLMFPALFIAFAGSLVFGFSAQYASPHAWVGLAFGIGMVSFSLMQVPSIGFTYIIEAYGEWAADCFIMITSFRAIISFAWTFFVGTWISEAGAAQPFGIFALLMALFGLTVVPVWLYGKRLRIASADWIAKRAY